MCIFEHPLHKRELDHVIVSTSEFWWEKIFAFYSGLLNTVGLSYFLAILQFTFSFNSHALAHDMMRKKINSCFSLYSHHYVR